MARTPNVRRLTTTITALAVLLTTCGALAACSDGSDQGATGGTTVEGGHGQLVPRLGEGSRVISARTSSVESTADDRVVVRVWTPGGELPSEAGDGPTPMLAAFAVPDPSGELDVEGTAERAWSPSPKGEEWTDDQLQRWQAPVAGHEVYVVARGVPLEQRTAFQDGLDVVDGDLRPGPLPDGFAPAVEARMTTMTGGGPLVPLTADHPMQEVVVISEDLSRTTGLLTGDPALVGMTLALREDGATVEPITVRGQQGWLVPVAIPYKNGGHPLLVWEEDGRGHQLVVSTSSSSATTLAEVGADWADVAAGAEPVDGDEWEQMVSEIGTEQLDEMRGGG